MKATYAWAHLRLLPESINRDNSKTNEIADLAEESVPRSAQILEPEFTRLLERRAVAEVDQGAGHGPVTEEPVGREFVADLTGIDHAVYEDRIPVCIAQRSPRARCVLTHDAEENRRTHLVLDLESWDCLRRKARSVGAARDR